MKKGIETEDLDRKGRAQMKKLRQLYLYWAYIDIEHTGDRKQTYFGRFREEATRKNYKLMRSLSVVMILISLFVFLITSFFFTYASQLQHVYSAIFFMHFVLFLFAGQMLKREKLPRAAVWLPRVYLLFILGFGVYIGTRFSVNESAAIFLVVLILSQMVFAIPPVITASMAAMATLATLGISYMIKSDRFFRADVMNCTGVLILSVLAGWFISRMRVEEAFARARVIELNAQLKQMSVTDQLTGLHNHRCFHDKYELCFQEALRKQTRIGIIMMDVDKFKAYNDHYGHLAGDDCLAAIGKALRSRENDEVSIYRFGGEEFVVLLTGKACETPGEVAQGLKAAVEQLHIAHAFSKAASVVTISAGICVAVPKHNDKESCFISQADQALYESKAKGGNCVTIQ